MVGGTGAFKILKQKLDKLIKSNGRILISDRLGLEKKLLQDISIKPQRFLTVACASIQSEKMEELLFGQEIEGKTNPGLLSELMEEHCFLTKLQNYLLALKQKS